MILSRKQKLSITAAIVGGLALTGFLYFRSSPKELASSPVAVTILNEAAALETEPVAKYVHYVSIDDSDNPLLYRRQLSTLTRTGSLTGSLGTQFKQATHAKMSYRFGRKKPTVFEPAPLLKIMPDGFVLTGREYDSADDGVYRSLYRLFERPESKDRIEIIESAIDITNPLERISELQNEQILGHPMLLERFIAKKSVVYYSAEIIIKDRIYQINTKGVDRAELMAFIEQLLLAQN